MTLEQLTDALARIKSAHHFILMHPMQTGFEGFEQHFYDFGLLLCEFVRLIPHHGRTKPELKT
jgi:hypothetical protein